MATILKRLGRYEVIDRIGRGGMGEVYRARDERLGRIVALKILHPEFAARKDLRTRFQREAKMLARLNHPHICTIHDVGSEDGVDFLVLECLEGESLASRLASSRLPMEVGLAYAVQIAEALSAAHNLGLIHRDLKPSNVFVTRAGAKLLDFGIACSAAADPLSAGELAGATTQIVTAEGDFPGTPGYIAPEVLEGQPADARSDMFSYGAVLFEMFAGRHAFKAGTQAGSIAAVLRDEAPSLRSLVSDIPAALDRLVANCLVKDANLRWQSARDAFLELRGLHQSLSDSRHTSRAATIQATFHRLTFNRGTIYSARFIPEGRDVIYSAAWEGAPVQVYLTRRDSPESKPLGFARAELLGVSPAGNLALSLERQVAGFIRTGILAQVPLAGAEPRRLLGDVLYADWTPDGERLTVVRRVGDRCQLEWPVGRIVYETEGLISHPRLSRDGTHLAFLDHPHYSDDGGAVAIVDESRAMRILSDGWRSAWGLAWSPDNREIWFTSAKGGAARALRGLTLAGQERLIARSTTPLTLHDVAPSGAILVSHDALRTTTLFRGEDESVESDLSYLDSTFPRDLSVDGTTLLFDETGEGGGPDYSVYVRPTAGGPAVRLGSGLARTLSPDGRWATTVDRSLRRGITVVPTGIGESFTLQHPEIDEYRAVNWLPDGRRIVFSGGKRGHGLQLFLQDVTSGTTRAISPTGIFGPAAVAPGGQQVVGIKTDDRSSWLVSVDAENAPTTIAGMTPSDLAFQWSADGSALYVRRRGGELPLRVYRYDLASGERALWKEVTISDRAGVEVIAQMLVTPDGKNYVITYARILSDLFLLTGVS